MTKAALAPTEPVIIAALKDENLSLKKLVGQFQTQVNWFQRQLFGETSKKRILPEGQAQDDLQVPPPLRRRRKPSPTNGRSTTNPGVTPSKIPAFGSTTRSGGDHPSTHSTGGGGDYGGSARGSALEGDLASGATFCELRDPAVSNSVYGDGIGGLQLGKVVTDHIKPTIRRSFNVEVNTALDIFFAKMFYPHPEPRAISEFCSDDRSQAAPDSMPPQTPV